MTRALLTALVLAFASLARAAEIVVTVGSSRKPYREVVEGIREVLGRDLEVVDLTQGEAPTGSQTRAIIAVGSRAALERYPDGVPVIYCLSPGLKFGPRGPTGRAAHVFYLAPPALVLERMAQLHPKLSRLGILWSSPWFEPQVADMTQQAQQRGWTVVSERPGSAAAVPDHLRRLRGKVDALWAPMDPALLDARTLEAIRAFAAGAGIPFFAPAAAIAERGFAAAAIGGSFREVGRAAARVARRAAAGEDIPTANYAQRVTVVINRQAARAQGLEPPAGALEKADKVMP